ncbi:MAG: hypothetical protein J3K34DRAFT_520870 [Monoraphidium minutum]|nr:MAG: hypothetical protein J3K34DRAFT_520870 [Monoraphidium minutum]
METNIAALWVPTVVFAHLFAAFWLIKTLLLHDPQALSCFWRRQKQVSSSILKARALQKAAQAALDENQATGSDVVLTVPRGSGKPSSGGMDQDSDDADAQGAMDVEGAPSEPAAADALYEDGSAAGGGGKRAHNDLLRVEPLELEWQRIGCSYRAANGPRVVLQDVYGKASPGEMQALLGPSGAGKSTLMDILAQRKSVGTLTGQLLVGGRPVGRGFIRKTAYVPQDDNFVPTMTTMETMRFYSSIILPESMGRAGRQARLEEVLGAMGLGTHHKTLVGGTLPGGLMLRGLSGGERKRLSIAVGILAAPSVVYLDEPTSGLDSFAALTVMGYMKRMARDNGQVVISSIHQPRSAIWLMFDTVTLLSCGRLMYTGIRDGLVEWFASRGFDYDAGVHGVASDWALDLVAVGFHKPKRFYGHTITSKEQLFSTSAAFVARYREAAGIKGEPQAEAPTLQSHFAGLGGKLRGAMRRSSASGSNPALSVSAGSSGAALVGGGGGVPSSSGFQASVEIQLAGPSNGGYGHGHSHGHGHGHGHSHGHAAAGAGAGAKAAGGGEQLEPAPAPMWATNWWSQYTSCLWRELLAVTRNPADVAGRTLTFSWVALLMGMLYFNMPMDASSLRGRLNLLFNSLVFFCLMPYVSMSLYTADKKFYIADSSAKLYRAHAYYAAKVTATVPFQILSALIFMFTIYGMAGLRPGITYIVQTGIVSSLLFLIAVQVLHCCALLAPNQDAAFMFSIMWSTVQMLMSNFFMPFADINFQWLTFLKWFSALYYSFEGLARIEFGGARFDCSAGVDPAGVTFLKELLPNSRFLNLSAVNNALTNPGPDCIADTDALLEFYQFYRPFRNTVAILFSYWVIVHICTYSAMVMVARKERR